MIREQRIGVVVPAAGRGSRMGGDVAKQFLELNGKPILVHTLERLNAIPEIDLIVVAAAQDDLILVRNIVTDYRINKNEAVVLGGDKRQDSVWNCLRHMSDKNIDIAVIHDAVRPFITRELVASVCTAAMNLGAAVPVLHPNDTVKSLNGDGFIKATLNRDELVFVQTPQAFRFSLIFQAYEKAMNEQFYATDDATLVERYGGKVRTVEGIHTNIKITTPEDLVIARQIAQ